MVCAYNNMFAALVFCPSKPEKRRYIPKKKATIESDITMGKILGEYFIAELFRNKA